MCLSYHCLRIGSRFPAHRILCLLILWMLLKIEQVLNISFRPLDRRKFQIQGLKSDGKRIIDHHVDHFQMNGRLSNNAFFPYFFPACFKLRFNQADDLPIVL